MLALCARLRSMLWRTLTFRGHEAKFRRHGTEKYGNGGKERYTNTTLAFVLYERVRGHSHAHPL